MKLYHIVMLCGQFPQDGDIRLISATFGISGKKRKENKKIIKIHVAL